MDSSLQFEQFDKEKAQEVSYLKAQLGVIDKAIHTVVDGSGPKKKKVVAQQQQFSPKDISFNDTPNIDNSFNIDTSSSETVTCPQCSNEVKSKQLKTHLSKLCKNKIIVCPEVGCGQSFPQQYLRTHQAKECEVSKKRRQLLEQAKARALDEKKRNEERWKEEREAQLRKKEESLMGEKQIIASNSTMKDDQDTLGDNLGGRNFTPDPAFTVCPQCGEAMKQSLLTPHLSKQCIRRPIMCPNLHFGCPERAVPLQDLHAHLRNCVVELNRDQMVARAQQRREPIQCPNCGQIMQLYELRKHERESCPNRLVPCRNHHLGCNVRVRLGERHQHELVDGQKHARIALYLRGHGSHLGIEEDDLASPWTAEYWILRSSAEESAKTQLRNIILQLFQYNLAYSAETTIRLQVMSLVAELRSEIPTESPEDAELSQEERFKRVKDLQQGRVDAMNKLGLLVAVYSDTVLSYIRAFQNVAISIEASEASIKEITSVPTYDENIQSQTHSLEGDHPGKVAAAKDMNEFIRKNLMTKTPVQEKAPSPPKSETTSVSLVAKDKKQGGTPDEDTSTDNENENEVEAEKETSAEKDQETPADIVLDAEHIALTVDTDPVENGAENPQLQQDKEKDKVHLSPPDFLCSLNSSPARVALESCLGSGNNVAALVYMCVHLQYEHSKESLSLPAPTVQEYPHPEKRGSWESEGDILTREEQTEWRERGLAAFVLDAVAKPERAVKDHLLYWSQWRKWLLVLRRTLKRDFDLLQAWRLETGLLKSDGSENYGSLKRASVLEDPMTAERTRILLKKEKAKKRREMRRQRKQEEEAEQLVEEAEDRPASQVKEDKLQTRVTELLKAGCAGEVLAESTSCTADGNRTRICLSAFSGLSLLLVPVAPTEAPEVEELKPEEVKYDFGVKEQRLRYDLLLHVKEVSHLLRCHGNVTIVNALPSSGRRDLHSADGGLSAPGSPNSRMSKPRGSVSDSVTLASASSAGLPAAVETRHFGVSVPRGRWTHLALVGTRRPQNRVSLYMNGLVVKNLKSFYFPLPMGAIGSAFCCSSFQGTLLDVRYWQVPRSALQIQTNLFRLLNLPEDRGGGPAGVGAGDADGLVGWWTFEEGPGQAHVKDVSGHRFQTPIQRTLATLLRGDRSSSDDRYPIPLSIQQALPTIFRDILTFMPHPTSSKVNSLVKPVNKSMRPISPMPLSPMRPSSPTKHSILADDFTVGSSVVSRPFGGVSDKTVASLDSSIQSSHRGMRHPGSALLREMKTFDWLDADSVLRSAPTGTEGEAEAGEEEEDLLPLPSFQQRNLCPFEVRRLRLATSGRELQRASPCPLDCGLLIRGLDRRFHVRFECEQRVVACRFSHCSSVFPLRLREHHEKKECVILFARKKYLSEAELNNTKFPCVLCSELTRHRDMQHHLSSECGQREVNCPRGDCTNGLKLPFYRLQHHLKYECDSRSQRATHLLIERARTRCQYPRPWGISVETCGYSDRSEGQQESIESTEQTENSSQIDFDDETV